MRKWLLLAALLLPPLWLGIGVASQERALAAATEWRIPIEGFDPRDPLRGRYVQFHYAWTLKGDSDACMKPNACRLCLSREGGAVIATVVPAGRACSAPVDLRTSEIDWLPTFDERSSEARFISRIFVSEASAPALEAQLRERPMVVVAALTADGRLINRRLEPATPAP